MNERMTTNQFRLSLLSKVNDKRDEKLIGILHERAKNSAESLNDGNNERTKSDGAKGGRQRTKPNELRFDQTNRQLYRFKEPRTGEDGMLWLIKYQVATVPLTVT